MSTNKSKKPELRFKGFSDDWEQRKLGDFGYVAMCKRIFKDQTAESGDIPFYKIGTFGGEPDAYISRDLFEEYKHLYSYPEKGDILISASGSIGRTVEYTGEDAYYQDSNIVWLKHDKTIVNSFLKHLYEVIRWSGIEGSTIKRLYNDNILKTEVMIPEAPEQEEIGKYFNNLDNLITLHQRKCENLIIIKKSMLDNLFPKNGEKVPRWRFKGFNDDWEQRKLENYIIEYHEVTTKNNQYPVLTSSRKGIFLQSEYYAGNQVASEDNTGYNIVPYGYFTYRHMSDDEIFHFNINDIVENGIVSTLYPVFTTNEELDSRYLQYQLNYGREFAKFALLQKQGGSRTYMYLNKLKKLELTIPKSIREQKMISGYLIVLDNLITLHQYKLYMMFYKKGTILTYFWEQRKFGELYKKSSEKNDGSISMDRNITVATMQFKEDVKVSTEDYLKTYYTFNVGDIAFEGHQSKEYRFGRFVENDIGNGIISHIFAVFRPIVDYDLQFWKYAINNESLMQRVLSRSTKASTMMHDLVTDDFLEQKFLVPSVKEQEQIGMFLSDLDHLITLHQSEVERLKKVKQFFLDKMFI